MSTFHLKISTPDGLQFEGEVERLRVRIIDGDVSLLAHHMDYVSAVGAGEAAEPSARRMIFHLPSRMLCVIIKHIVWEDQHGRTALGARNSAQ